MTMSEFDSIKTYDTIDNMFAALEARRAAKPRFVRWAYSKSFAGYNLWYWLGSPWKFVTELPLHYAHNLRWFVQRGRKGYSTHDTWSLDYYILRWLPDALDQLANEAHGWPQSDEFPEFEDWTQWLRDMAELLRPYQDQLYVTEETERIFTEVIWPQLGRHFFSLWD